LFGASADRIAGAASAAAELRINVRRDIPDGFDTSLPPVKTALECDAARSLSCKLLIWMNAIPPGVDIRQSFVENDPRD
jgi:hypothetical protein